MIFTINPLHKPTRIFSEMHTKRKKERKISPFHCVRVRTCSMPSLYIRRLLGKQDVIKLPDNSVTQFSVNYHSSAMLFLFNLCYFEVNFVFKLMHIILIAFFSAAIIVIFISFER